MTVIEALTSASGRRALWTMSPVSGILYPADAVLVLEREAQRINAECALAEERHRIQREAYAAERWRNSATGKAHAELVKVLAHGSPVFEAAKSLATAAYDTEMDRRTDETTGCHYFYECDGDY